MSQDSGTEIAISVNDCVQERQFDSGATNGRLATRSPEFQAVDGIFMYEISLGRECGGRSLPHSLGVTKRPRNSASVWHAECKLALPKGPRPDSDGAVVTPWRPSYDAEPGRR
jgi:hypothetical protein